jgi:hypothetical protein
MAFVVAPAALPAPPAAPRWQRRLVPLALASLLLLVIQGWAPQLRAGDGAAPATPASPAAPTEGPGVADGVERATHAPTPVAGRPGVLEVHDPAYRAVFDATGLTYAPEGGGGALALGLAGAERGGAPIAVAPRTWEAEANTAVREVAPGMTERVTARNGEVEWDVVLASPPSGAGDLTIAAGLAGTEGPPAAVADGRALRFELAGGGRVAVDEVVVVDATGTELHRALPRVAGDELVLDVPAAVLDGARYPLTVDPTVAAAQPVTEDDGAMRPSVAFDGNGYLVVWGSAGDIWGARLNTAGAIVVSGIPISTSNKLEIYPDVAWNGDSYYVVWQHQFGTSTSDWDIYGRRLTASGNLIGAPHVVNGPGADQQLPSVAAITNGGFYVVWQDGKNAGSGSPQDVYGVWVSLNGVVDTTPAQRLSFDAKWEDNPDVAWNGAHFLVIWELYYAQADHDIKGVRVAPGAGGSAFGGFLSIATPTSVQSNPSVASDGSRSLVVWDDNRNGDFDIYGSVVDQNGVVDANTAIARTTRYQGTPELAWNGVYLVAWRDERRTAGRYDIYASRVDADGSPIDSSTTGFLVASGAGTTGVGDQVLSRGAGSEWGVVHRWTTATSNDAGIRLNRAK